MVIKEPKFVSQSIWVFGNEQSMSKYVSVIYILLYVQLCCPRLSRLLTWSSEPTARGHISSYLQYIFLCIIIACAVFSGALSTLQVTIRLVFGRGPKYFLHTSQTEVPLVAENLNFFLLVYRTNLSDLYKQSAKSLYC